MNVKRDADGGPRTKPGRSDQVIRITRKTSSRARTISDALKL